MTAVKEFKGIPVADYLTGEKLAGVKHEFIGGAMHAMAGASNLHNSIAGNIFASLHARLRGQVCRPFNSDTKVRIVLSDHTRFYYPDVMVVCHQNSPDDHFQDQPTLVVEVLSEGTRRTDLGEKRDAYLTIASLKLLLFVDPETRTVALHRREPEGAFAIEVFSHLDDTIPLPEVGVDLPLADIFEE